MMASNSVLPALAAAVRADFYDVLAPNSDSRVIDEVTLVQHAAHAGFAPPP
jgi:hypothetical protein